MCQLVSDSPWPGHGCPEALWEVPEGCVRKVGSGEYHEASRREAKSRNVNQDRVALSYWFRQEAREFSQKQHQRMKRRWAASGARLPVLRALLCSLQSVARRVASLRLRGLRAPEHSEDTGVVLLGGWAIHRLTPSFRSRISLFFRLWGPCWVHKYAHWKCSP